MMEACDAAAWEIRLGRPTCGRIIHDVSNPFLTSARTMVRCLTAEHLQFIDVGVGAVTTSPEGSSRGVKVPASMSDERSILAAWSLDRGPDLERRKVRSDHWVVTHYVDRRLVARAQHRSSWLRYSPVSR